MYIPFLAASVNQVDALRLPALLRLAEGALVGRETVGWIRERATRRNPPTSQLRPNRDAGIYMRTIYNLS